MILVGELNGNAAVIKRTAIFILFGHSCPSAVRWLIVSIHINSVDRQSVGITILDCPRVEIHKIFSPLFGKSKKAVVHWREPGNKPMILNVARSKNIEKVAGSGYFEDWPGVTVQLYIEHGIKAFGEVVSAVRVRPYKPRLQQRQPVPPCTDCGNRPHSYPPAWPWSRRTGIPLSVWPVPPLRSA